MGSEHSKLRANKKAENVTGKPPPYSTSSGSTPAHASGPDEKQKKRKCPEIKASDVPQWKWNNVQCQEWLTAAIMEYCGKSEEKAAEKAREFLRGGFAPLLYMASFNVWESYLGVEDAAAIFSYLTAVKEQPGAVPSGEYLSRFDMKTKPGWDVDRRR